MSEEEYNFVDAVETIKKYESKVVKDKVTEECVDLRRSSSAPILSPYFYTGTGGRRSITDPKNMLRQI